MTRQAERSNNSYAATSENVGPAHREQLQRRRRLRLRRTVILGLLVVAIASLVAANWQILTGSIETRAIAAKRAAYRALWALGQTLPGTPDLAALDQRLAASGFTLAQPILIRIYKRDFELEIWKAKDGRFHHFATYPICRWSGRLGPKLKQGDRQSPEGFYAVGKNQLNPNSRWHRSFNLGFPNLYDRVHGRTGSFLMVHGGCSSVGCYAVTNAAIDEIWRLVTSALDGGQHRFQVQAFPFRMTEDNLAAKTDDPLYPFWQSLKKGSDVFEATGLPPRVRLCKGEYVFLPGSNIHSARHPILAACATSSHVQQSQDN
ncbi:MAG: hypothetical protein AB7U75_05340 [Hyphomicrobiaceae bacterium]